MRNRVFVRLVALIALTIALLGCAGVFNWVRVSPDGDYVTLVNHAEKTIDILLLYDLSRRESQVVYKRPSEEESLLLYDVQWRPDSRAFSFIVQPEPFQDGGLYAEEKDNQSALMLFEINSRRLLKLPIDAPKLARWSRDGRRLLTLKSGSKTQSTLEIYATDAWVRLRTLPMPEDAQFVSPDTLLMQLLDDETVVALMDLPASAEESNPTRPAGKNLYRFHFNRWQPLTTTGDVYTFWIAPLQDRVRWVRVVSGQGLAVFERPLPTHVPRRLAFISHEIAPAREGQVYRFSPDGNQLAWVIEETLYVLNLSEGTVRTFGIIDLQPQTVSLGIWGETKQMRYPMYGFDWRGNDALVLQRGDKVEVISIHRAQE